MITLRTLDPDDWAEWRAMRLDALSDAPYAFSSRLADWVGRGDTERRWRSRLETVPFNVLAFMDGRAAGQVSGTARRPDGSVMLISMWVAAHSRGLGVGDALVDAVVEWARAQAANRVVLDVVPTNLHAIALYERRGFALTGHRNEHDEREMVKNLA